MICCTPIDSFPVVIPLRKSLSAYCLVHPAILIRCMYYACSLAIISQSTTIEPCRVARFLQPCWLGTFTRHILTEPCIQWRRTVLARKNCVMSVSARIADSTKSRLYGSRARFQWLHSCMGLLCSISKLFSPGYHELAVI